MAPRFLKPLRLVDHVTRNGAFFFTPQAMRFFDSRVNPTYLRRLTTDRYLLVVSNQYHPMSNDEPDGEREWAIVAVNAAAPTADYATDERYPDAATAIAAANAITL